MKTKPLSGMLAAATMLFGCANHASLPKENTLYAPETAVLTPSKPSEILYLPVYEHPLHMEAIKEARKLVYESIEISEKMRWYAIIVSKKDRKITIYNNGHLTGKYAVGLGFEPEEDKEMRDDGRTPEGRFYVVGIGSSFHGFLHVSYPNSEDAERGLEKKLITKEEEKSIIASNKLKEYYDSLLISGKMSLREYKSLMARDAKKMLPLQHTKLGGEIGIHGEGSTDDWTLGCIALNDEDLYAFFKRMTFGVPILIVKEY